MESTVKERLVRFIKHSGLSVNAFEKKCGFSTGFVGNMRKSMQPDKIQTISKLFPTLNTNWLMTGEGEMFNNEIVGFPFFEHPIYCGMPSDFDNAIDASKANERIVLPNVQGDFALRVSGDSMIDVQHPEKSIPDGSIVVLKKVSDSILRWGEIYAIATTDGFMIKKIMPLDEERVECRSLNVEEYPPFAIQKNDIYGFARVVAVINCKLY